MTGEFDRATSAVLIHSDGRLSATYHARLAEDVSTLPASILYSYWKCVENWPNIHIVEKWECSIRWILCGSHGRCWYKMALLYVLKTWLLFLAKRLRVKQQANVPCTRLPKPIHSIFVSSTIFWKGAPRYTIGTFSVSEVCRRWKGLWDPSQNTQEVNWSRLEWIAIRIFS